nr:hypothetical protein [Halovenus rubra]
MAVHISREGLHTLEVPASFETTDSFDIRLVNHSEALHVHLHLDDPLSKMATLDAGNHYVEAESERQVRVTVDERTLEQEAKLGKLKVASAYGAETRWIDIKLSKPDPKEETVQVDESLAKPQPRHEENEPGIENPARLVLGLGFGAVLIAALAAAAIGAPLVAGGAVVVFGGVLVALFFLVQDIG